VQTWPDKIVELNAELKGLRSGAPEVMKSFTAMAQAALAPRTLDVKTKELIAIGIAVAVRGLYRVSCEVGSAEWRIARRGD